MSAVRWGMLSTAGIGRMVALAVRGSGDTRFVAVASRDAAKARGFAAEFGLPLSFVPIKISWRAPKWTPSKCRCRSQCTPSGRSGR
jgi:predicted dehydrogenase